MANGSAYHFKKNEQGTVWMHCDQVLATISKAPKSEQGRGSYILRYVSGRIERYESWSEARSEAQKILRKA